MTTAGASATQTGAGEGSQGAAAGASTTQAIDYKFDPIEGIQLTPEFDQDIAALGKEMGWDQATAAKFRAREAKQAHEAMLADKTASEQAQAKAKLEKEQADTQRRTEWEKANRDHKEFGGPKYAETSERVKQLVDRFDADKSFAKELEQAPELLNLPAFRGFLARIAYSMAEGTFHQGSTATNQTQSRADRMFGKTTPAA